ncbi:glycosyltransferase family A protein [Oceanobacillus senegalensis]|uniref:glycosyltransferase family A protein n=1 Tax=Oceanobacillus senegalensis TaxID=1936063 RepID=UPI000A3067D6|nr:glycosyltransferase family 2 protein [Oceanobacillus senegalensis]
MNDIVILTPTYNRANTLPRLYESLKVQIDNNFKWLIIDDGSTDKTSTIVAGMLKEKKINIDYIYQENGGKARALNKGFSLCESALVFAIVDSDDYLNPSAVSTIKKYLTRYAGNKKIGAFFFHYNTTDGNVLKPKGQPIKVDHEMTPYEYYRNFGKHDGCICYLNKVTNKYKYPEFEGEKYVGPTVLQLKMSDEYKIVYSPEVIGVAEYQEGGLTQNGRQLRLRNPMGMMYYAKLMMSPKANISTQFKYAISIWPYAKIANKSFFDVIRLAKRPFLLGISYFPGQLLYLKWRKILE